MKTWSSSHLYSLLEGMQNGIAAVCNSMEVHQKITLEPPCDSAIPLLALYSEELKVDV